MKTKIRTKFINLFVVLLVLTGNVLQGTAPVFALSGTVAASATASNAAPAIGTELTVNIHIDMTNVDSPDNNLGSYTATLNWNPAVLSYASYIVPPGTGFTGVVNTGSVGTGLITFNGANATGATGDIIVLAVGFNVIGAGDAGLDLAFSAMAAAGTFADLLPIVNATEDTVTVPGEPVGVVEIDGDAHSQTGAANASSVSFDHTTGTGENRLTMVGVSWNAGSNAQSISSVVFTYDTTETLNFSLVRTEENTASPRFAAIYRSATEPPLNKTGTLTVTFSGAVSNGIVAGAVNFKGVDQTTPLGTDNGANGSSTAASVTLTGLTGNELVFDTVFQGASAETQTLTAGAGQSQHWNAWISNTRAAASTEQAAGSSVTMSWTAQSSSVWAIAAVPIRPALSTPPTCYALTLTTSGLSGSAITTDLANSPGCPTGQYVEGQVIGLTAHPDWGYEVQAWSGTDNDSSTELTNVVTMPAEARTVNVTYQSKTCYDLVLTSGDNGGDPTADPSSSQACTLGGTFVEGEVITLTASPDSGYRVASWTGTDDDESKALTNTLTMPAQASTVNVTYEEIPPQVTLDGAVSSTTADDVSVVSFNHTTGTGLNRLMLVGVSWNCGTADRTISSISFTPDGGSALGLSEVITQLGYSTSSPRYSAIYSLLSPPSGEVGSVTITFSGSVSNGIMAGAANFSGVDQVTPLGTPAGTNANSTSPSVELTELSGDELVFDNVFLGAGSSSSTLTAGAGQTQLWNPAYVANLRAAASTEQAISSSVTMSWTASTGNYWAITAVPINPGAGGPTQQLTMAVTPEGGGTVTPVIGTYVYAQNAVVPITATPATGYTFSHWTPDEPPGDPIANPGASSTTVTMDADYTVTAHFAPITHTLTVNFVGGGSVMAEPANLGPYNYGTEVKLTAIPDSGWLFDGWSGDLSGMVNPQTITMDADKTVTATFVEMQPETVYLDGPIAYDVMESGSTLSIPTQTGSGQNRLMLVGVSYNCSGSTAPRPNITSVTFTPDGGSALALDLVIDETSPPDQTEDPGRKAAIYALTPSLNPAASTAGVVEVTFSGSFTSGAVAGVAHFQGVDQTTPLGTPGGAGTAANEDNTLSVTLTTSGKELVFDTVWTGGQPSWTMTAVSPQIDLWNDGFQNTMGGASVRDAETGTTTMTWNRSNDGYMALVAVPINPVSEAETGTIIIQKQTIPDGHEQTFEFTGAATGTISDGGQIVVEDLVVGIHQVQEVVPSGWKLLSVACNDGNSTASLPTNSAIIVLEADETVTCVFTNSLPLDFGDAPDTYKTLLASDGARHLVDGPVLGYLVDDEWDGLPTALANGDDTDFASDEDGVSFPTAAPLIIGANAQVGVVLSQPGGKLDAWIDFNRDGDFDHPSEHLWNGESQDFSSPPFPSPTTYFLDFSVPASAVAGVSYARFRLSTAGGLQPYGYASDGEVEDYRVEILEPESYTVTFDANGGTGTMDPQTASVPTALSANTFTRDGYAFSGWNTEIGGGGTAYADGETYDFSADMTLYAQWTELGIIIIEKQTVPDGHAQTFEFTGDVTGTISDGQQIIEQNLAAGTYQVAETVPYEWKLQTIVCDDLNSTPDLPNNRVDIALEAGETVKCVFTNSLPLEFGDAPDSYKTLFASNGASHVYADTGPSMGVSTDWELDGQPSPLANGDDTHGAIDEDGVTFPTVPLTADSGETVSVVVYGTAGKLDAWIDYDGNGSFDHPREHLWGGTSQVVSTNGSHNFEFITPADAEVGVTYARFRVSTAGSLLPHGIAADGEVEDYRVEILAPVSHTVTFDANGGSGTMGPQTASVSTALSANTFTRDGYAFSGWNTEIGGGGTAYADGADYDFSADITLYAQWTANTYAVTFDANGGSTPSPETKDVTYDSAYGTLATTSRNGYSFAGWYTAATDGTEVTAATIVTTADDHTLYARWTANTYTVTFDANDGDTPSFATKQVTYGSAYGELATTSRTGYIFAGWYTAATDGTLVTSTTTVATASDHTLYAHWSDLPTLTVTADAGQTKVYGTADPSAFTYSYAPNDPPITFTGALSRVAGEDAGTYAITQGDLAATGYTIIFVSADFTITPKAASVTPNAASKIYGDAEPTLTGVLTGFLPADAVTAVYARAAGETVAGSPYLISATLSPAGVLGNYDITYNTADFTITKKAASVTPNAASKIYGDAEPTLTGTLSGFLTGDSVEATYSRTAGETVAGSPYTISATLSPAGVLGNYDITFNTADFTITKKAASVTPNAASKIYGDAEPTLTGVLTGFLPADAVTAVYARAAGETVAGSPYLISATLNPAGVLGNYNITYNTANFTINLRPITVTADDKSKFVGQLDPPLTYTVTTGSLAFSDAFTGALARISGELVGTYAITRGNLALNANYNMTFIEGTLTISEIPTVTVTVDGGQTKVYGQSDPIFTYQSSDPEVEFTGALSRVAGEDVDTYAITQGDLAADGYVINFVPANFTITAKPITVNADAQTKVYGDIDPDLTYQYTPDLISGDGFIGTLQRAVGEGVGTYAISQGTLNLGSNYTITFTGANLTITTRPITVTADDKIKNQGTVDPPFTYSITSGSLAFSDTFTGALARIAGETIGAYPIIQGNLALNANYDMTFVAGTLTIIAGTEHQIDLVAGWNLVSFNLTPSDPDIEVILADIMGDVILVYGWNGATGTWLRFDPGVGFGNTLTELNEAMGFWINMDAAATLTMTGTEPTTTDIPLYTGWNLIGYPSDAGDVLPGALSGIADKYNLVMAYHAADTSDPWKLYEPDVPDWVTDLDQLDPGWGYWIDMTEGATLSIDFD